MNLIYLVLPNNFTIYNIHKWNLTTLAWDGTIGPVIPNFRGNDLLVMSDDTIIAMCGKSASPFNSNIIRRYDLVGTSAKYFTINTTVNGTAGPRLGYAADPEYFWVWIFTIKWRFINQKN